HLGGIGGIDVEGNTFKNNKGLRLLDIVKKTHERGPRALDFEGSKDRLPFRRGVARADRGILEEDVVFAGDLLDLIEQRRSFARSFQGGLMFLEPLGVLLPKGALANENLLDFARVLPRRQIGAGVVERTEQLAPKVPIQEQKNNGG